jgi:carbonic anhydrase
MPATEKLIEGYLRFRNGFFKEKKTFLKKLAEDGQAPKIVLISCCDARVEPSIIFDCEPGDLFVIRNVANLVPPCETNDSYHGTSAALDFAVRELEVESIIILGHTNCGGIKNLMDKPLSPLKNSFISTWMMQLDGVKNKIIHDGKFSTPEERCHACEQYGVLQSLQNLRTFPWINERVIDGRLMLHGWYYDLTQAKLYAFEDNKEGFQQIS